MSSDVQITLAIAVFFIVLAALTFMRLLLRKQPPSWRSIRLGVYVERVPDKRKDNGDDLRDD